MENNKSNDGTVLTGKCQSPISSAKVMVVVLIALMILLFFILPIASHTDSYGTWKIKSGDALENAIGSVGFCMKDSGVGFFRNFVFIVPLLWVLTAIFAFVKKNIGNVLMLVSTAGFIMFALFLIKGVNKSYGYGMSLSLGIGFWVIIGLSVVALVMMCCKRSCSASAPAK